MNDCYSGLGIGGVGSDDHNINTEPANIPDQGSGRGFGKYGIRYDEKCSKCRRITDVCNWCEFCENHCIC